MVHRGRSGFKNLNDPAPRSSSIGIRSGSSGGTLDHLHERRAIEQSGTAAGQQDPTGFDQLDRKTVQVDMLAGSLFEFGPGSNEFRRIEDDDVELFVVSSHIAHVGECIRMDISDSNVIDISVFLGHDQGFFVKVDSDNLGGLARFRGRDGEAPGIATNIEHTFPGGMTCQDRAVLALVAEKSGFVSRTEMDPVLDLVLVDRHVRRKIFGLRVLPDSTLLACELRRGANQSMLGTEQRMQAFENLCGSLGHSQTENLGA
jgi:hypothetical protein